jgi:hypothetical protein
MQNLTQLERNVEALEELRRSHRVATLGAVATGSLTADEAMVRVDTVRSLEALTRHAWRSSANLVGLDKQPDKSTKKPIGMCCLCFASSAVTTLRKNLLLNV